MAEKRTGNVPLLQRTARIFDDTTEQAGEGKHWPKIAVGRREVLQERDFCLV